MFTFFLSSDLYAMFVFVPFVLCLFLNGCRGATPIKTTTGSKTPSGDLAYPDDLNVRDAYREDFHHSPHYHNHPEFHHHHHHHYHESKQGSRDDRAEVITQIGLRNSSMQIPLDYVQNLVSYNVSDLLLHFVEGYTDEDQPFIQDRFAGGDSQERSASAVMPKQAGCLPELTTVRIASSDDPSVLYIPQCTRIERCGGCCSHNLLSCQPQQMETVNFKVVKTQYTGNKKLKLVGKEIVAVEKHTSCKCDCRIKAEDCNRFQEYRKSECRCACTNYDEEKKCNKSTSVKLWNPDLCACQCRETMACSTGYYFDQNECRCMGVPMKRRFATYERKARSEPLSVISLGEN